MFQGAGAGRGPLDSRACPLPSPKHSPRTALTSPARHETQPAPPGVAASHVVAPPSLYSAQPARQEKKKKKKKRWRVTGLCEGLGQAGGVAFTQHSQDRTGLAMREEEEGPTATTQDEGVPVCHQGWLEEVQTSRSPLPLLHSLLVREQGPSRTQHLQNAAKRQQWWGRGRETRPD